MKTRNLTYMRGTVFALMLALMMLLCIHAASASAQSVVDGQSGQAILFNHDEAYVEIPLIDAYNADNIGVEAWIYPYQILGDQWIINLPGAVNLLLSQDHACFQVDGIVSHQELDRVTRDGPVLRWVSRRALQRACHTHVDIQAGQWTHVAGNYNPSTKKITVSVNGSDQSLYRAGYSSERYTIRNATDPLYIGRLASGNAPFNGRIDEVRTWVGTDVSGAWNFDALSPNTEPPEIVLNGDADMTLEWGVAYADPGATATDPASETDVVDSGPHANDGVYYSGEPSVPVTIDGSVGAGVGDYTLTYTATDAAGNAATETRVVHVVIGGITSTYTYEGTLEFDGQTSYSIGSMELPSSFTVSADVRVDASSQWQHLIEIGTIEHGWDAPLRFEVGDEGEWLVSVGNGNDRASEIIQGHWQYGDWTQVKIIYQPGNILFFENDALLAEVPANIDLEGVSGSLILGSFGGSERFFDGALKHVVISGRR